MRTWLNVIDEVLCMIKGRAMYTDEVENAHHVLRCVLEGQITVDWLQQLVVERSIDEEA